MGKITFNNSNSQFFQSLKIAVEAHFKSKNIKKTGDWRLYSKGLILIPGAVIIYITLLAVDMPAGLSIALCALMGLVMASIGFNVMHDACHGSYSSKKWVNNILGLTSG